MPSILLKTLHGINCMFVQRDKKKRKKCYIIVVKALCDLWVRAVTVSRHTYQVGDYEVLVITGLDPCFPPTLPSLPCLSQRCLAEHMAFCSIRLGLCWMNRREWMQNTCAPPNSRFQIWAIKWSLLVSLHQEHERREELITMEKHLLTAVQRAYLFWARPGMF